MKKKLTTSKVVKPLLIDLEGYGPTKLYSSGHFIEKLGIGYHYLYDLEEKGFIVCQYKDSLDRRWYAEDYMKLICNYYKSDIPKNKWNDGWNFYRKNQKKDQ